MMDEEVRNLCICTATQVCCILRKNTAKWHVTKWRKQIGIIILCKGMLLELHVIVPKIGPEWGAGIAIKIPCSCLVDSTVLNLRSFVAGNDAALVYTARIAAPVHNVDSLVPAMLRLTMKC